MAAKKLSPVTSVEGDEAEETVQFNFRIPKRLLAELDGWLADMNRGRRLGKVTRAEVLRAILERDVVLRPSLEQEDDLDDGVKIALHDTRGNTISEAKEEIDEIDRIQWFAVDKNGESALYRGKLIRKQYLIERAPGDISIAKEMADRDLRELNLSKVHAAAILLSTPSGKAFFDEWLKTRRPTKGSERDVPLPRSPENRILPRSDDLIPSPSFVVDQSPHGAQHPGAAKPPKGK